MGLVKVRGGGISSVRKVEKLVAASKVLNTMETSVGPDIKTISVVRKREDIIGNVHLTRTEVARLVAKAQR